MSSSVEHPTLIDRIEKHLSVLYGDSLPSGFASKLIEPFEAIRDQRSSTTDRDRWDQRDIWLLTYGDSIRSDHEPPLVTLKKFVDRYVGQAVSAIHVLPFFPYTSDDGFAVADFEAVNPHLGTWDEIRNLATDHRLMFDLVINHISSQHPWFLNYQRGADPGRDYFIEVNPGTELTDVVRPRTSPLLCPVETPEGTRHVWCTFSHDQVDLNFSNPTVLLEMIRVVAMYVQQGASIIRLDAIGYLWKQIGTSCIHLPETHEVVRLLRTLLDEVAPGTVLITETNVPNNENLSYFGNRNEAHVIYNFSLAPLVLHALLAGKSTYLQRWMRSMPPGPVGCTYLNFTASHDGIGMRPAEGLLSDEEQSMVVEAVRSFGGLVSSRKTADGGEKVYELNVSFFDALKGTFAGEDAFQVERFLCSQTIAMGLEGIPAVYIHSLLGTPNDLAGVQASGRNRSINRHQWDEQELIERLEEIDSTTSQVHAEMVRRLKIRTRQPAFHPEATQFTLVLPTHFFGFWRQSRDREQSIFAVYNLTNQTQTLAMEDLNLISTDQWWDMIGGRQMPGLYGQIEVEPYGALWISNAPVDAPS